MKIRKSRVEKYRNPLFAKGESICISNYGEVQNFKNLSPLKL
jgi:hypothetical protein